MATDSHGCGWISPRLLPTRARYQLSDIIRSRALFRHPLTLSFSSNLPFLQIIPTVAFLFFFSTDSMHSPNCVAILLSVSVFFYFLVFLFVWCGPVWSGGVISHTSGCWCFCGGGSKQWVTTMLRLMSWWRWQASTMRHHSVHSVIVSVLWPACSQLPLSCRGGLSTCTWLATVRSCDATLCRVLCTYTFNDPLSTTTWVSWYQSGFYWSRRQWVAVASAGPYASLHLAADR